LSYAKWHNGRSKTTIAPGWLNQRKKITLKDKIHNKNKISATNMPTASRCGTRGLEKSPKNMRGGSQQSNAQNVIDELRQPDQNRGRQSQFPVIKKRLPKSSAIPTQKF